ncbi:double-strand break repair helicase AddA [Dongia deserti]|uniref:double-strand break repair helicase AddA n=1 Tax=Dongia deserti TaxID=2268030 RepID=UPI000E65604E|nr:double-strand break repair helicase AddA [Dongia deserti]
MTAVKRDILRQATEAQRRGSDPSYSAWVSASAGSGKTKVLGDRVVRLLLSNVPPAKILCLTFTKAAAAEMSNRIAERLASWAAASDDTLRAELRALTGGKDTAALMPVARRLFARVLDTPGGMKIMTIHAFCQSLLRRFPLEAEVAPHFTLIEERDATALMGEARDEMLNAARNAADTPLRQALDMVVARMLEGRLNDLMKELFTRRARFERLIDSAEMPAIRTALRRLLKVGEDETRESVLAEAVADIACNPALLRRAADALARGSDKDQERAETLRSWLNADPTGRAETFDDYCSLFFTQDGSILKRLATKGAVATWSDLVACLTAEADRLAKVREKLRAVEVAVGTEALIHVSADVLRRYARRKAVAAQLDYEDLIQKAVDLLQRPGIAPWVLYKLDGGIDHVLIDEAQDTNPEQWRVIAALTEEFFAGQGASENPRSIFAVGDRKQSIFSFQGAAPEEFLRYEQHYGQRVDRFQSVPLRTSFRSTEAVLEIVDTVFGGAARAGVAAIEEDISHRVSRIGEFGEIVIWPIAKPIAADSPAPWSPPTIRELAAAPEARLAESIAAEIAHLRESGSTHQNGVARRVTAGDVMILVRNRTKFMDLMVRALKRRAIPVVGVDRMTLLDQIAVMDLIAFCRFLLLPEDDLNLAALLKSPLVGVTEEELFELCVDRGRKNLWMRVQELADAIPAAARARDLLEPFLDRAGFATPYEQLSELLEAAGGRQRLYARLGDECGEAIDEFLNLALAYESRHAPNLQDMLAWMEQGELQVKRDLDEGAGRVRIMTVHGAKGLEAPIVFLADQRRRPQPLSGLFWIEAGDAQIPIWSPNMGSDDPVAAAARAEAMQRQQEEENRLLYVALTRAEERLYVCGWCGLQPIKNANWHDHVREAAMKAPHVRAEERPAWLSGPEDGWNGDLLRVTAGELIAAVAAPAPTQSEVALPAWLNAPIPDLPDPPRPLTPSRPSEPDPATLSPLGEDQGWRYQRGRVIHHLLEMLPQLPKEARLAAAQAYVARRSSAVPPAEREPLARDVTALLDVPEFAAIFGPDSRAEVPVVATRRAPDGRTEVLSGQIDRLVVLDDEVWVVDFKSNRPAPMQVMHVSQQYMRQLGAYRSALSNLYETKRIRCFLLWTEGPRLMEIPIDMLNAHG